MSKLLRLNDELIANLWQRIRTATQHRHSYLTDKPMQPIEAQPASEDDIAELEEFWGFKLPSSYRIFISKFNGVERFAYTTPLLSIGQIIHRRYDWDVVDELNPDLLNFVFAAGIESDLYFVFDATAARVDNELPVIVYTSNGSEERHESFYAFLTAYLAALEAGIAREKADREGLD